LAKTPANIGPPPAQKILTANLGFAGSWNFFSPQIQIPIDYQKFCPDSKKKHLPRFKKKPRKKFFNKYVLLCHLE
jgi:hypothetical protein